MYCFCQEAQSGHLVVFVELQLVPTLNIMPDRFFIFPTLQRIIGRPITSHPGRSNANHLAEAQQQRYHQRRQSTLWVSSLQDKWKERHPVYDWSFHKLCAFHSAWHKQTRSTLDKARHSLALPDWRLKTLEDFEKCLGKNIDRETD